MEYQSIHDWIDKNSIRIVRQGQRNFYVEADVATSIGAAPIRPGQYHLGVAEFERISIENTPTICLTANGLQKLYARTSGKLDIEGGMSSLALNSPSLANTQSDWVAPPEPELAYESPIQKALMPYLPNLINPNHAIMITPELARTLLGVNVANRPKNNRNFKKLCAQLRAGKWKVNGATITLSRNWKLLDGQHRLYAIDETGIAALCILGYGFDPDVFSTLDRGAKRTNSDNLAIAGFGNTRLLASAIGVYRAIKTGSVVNNKTRAIEPEECIRFAVETPHMKTAVQKAKEYHRQGARFVSDAIVGGIMARGLEIDKRTTTKSFDYLLNDNCKGVRPDCVQKLRTKLLRDYMDKTRSNSSSFVAAIIIKTWNAYRKGKSVGALKFQPETVVDGVATGESYPVMV